MIRAILIPLLVIFLGTSASILSTVVWLQMQRVQQAERAARDAIAEHRMCTCTINGSSDDFAFDISLGAVKATPELAESMVIGPRAACGPVKLQAWLGSN